MIDLNRLRAVRCLPYRSICQWRRLIAALQDCVVQIGRMRFARVECDDHALVREIDFYVSHSGNVLQHRSQFAHAFIAIFTFSGDFDRFQNRVVGAFRRKMDRPDRDQKVVQGPWRLDCLLINVRSERSGRLPDQLSC